MWGKHIQKVLSQHKPPTTNHHTDHQHLFNIQIIYNSHFVPHSSMFYILRAWSQGFFPKNLYTVLKILNCVLSIA